MTVNGKEIHLLQGLVEDLPCYFMEMLTTECFKMFPGCMVVPTTQHALIGAMEHMYNEAASLAATIRGDPSVVAPLIIPYHTNGTEGNCLQFLGTSAVATFSVQDHYVNEFDCKELRDLETKYRELCFHQMQFKLPIEGDNENEYVFSMQFELECPFRISAVLMEKEVIVARRMADAEWTAEKRRASVHSYSFFLRVEKKKKPEPKAVNKRRRV